MLSSITPFAVEMGVDPRTLILLGLCFGSLLVILSLVSLVRERSTVRVRARMRSAGGTSGTGVAAEDAFSVFVAPEIAPGGLAKAFLPTKQRERNKVRRDLVHAGFTGPNAVLHYYAIRVGVGLVLPALMALAFLFREALPLPEFVSEQMGKVPSHQLLMLFGVMILVGFYGPALWLSSRASDRRQRVERGFPNALDLLQVAIETGLGLDAAIARVAAELKTAAPEIACELEAAQKDILAGRDRDSAYLSMAERLAIDEGYALVNVILQSMRFGTSMSQSLLTYSAEMRQRRELLAQEKANRLPVLMSAVMATLMMPALLIVTIGPVLLRYIQAF